MIWQFVLGQSFKIWSATHQNFYFFYQYQFNIILAGTYLPQAKLIYPLFYFIKFEPISMKATSKVHSLFTSKFSAILTKFKDNSTIQVGHEQLRNVFGEFALKDIITPFLTKMDTSQQLSEREKRQYSKVYTALVENYKEEVLSDQFFERIMQSLNKKSIGVSEVIAHLCKTLLNRIQDPQVLYPFVSIIINIFHNHVQIPKILKQIIEIIDSSVIYHLQEAIITILHEKINNAKAKNQYLQTILSLVLNLEEKLTVETQVTGFLLKYLKHDDWNCRKICVDIGYAFLVIKHQIAQNLHQLIKQLKYDKIKHVRDSVTNYQALYKQTYGQEVTVKSTKSISFRQTKIKAQQTKKAIAKSPAPIIEKQYTQNSNQKPHSQQKSGKPKIKNQNFFKNAKNSDVIKISQNKSSFIQIEKQEQQQNSLHNFSVHIPKVKLQQPKPAQSNSNFQDYLKKRNSPRLQMPKLSQSGAKRVEADKNAVKLKAAKDQQAKIPKFNYQHQFQHFKKKNKINESQASSSKIENRKEQSMQANQIIRHNEDVSISFAQSKLTNNIYDQFVSMFKQFQKNVNNRLDSFQRRLIALQSQKKIFSFNEIMQNGKAQSYQAKNASIHQSPKSMSMYYNQTPNQSNWESSFSQNVQSNLQQKVRLSIANQNWDEAFTLALTNNKKNILLNLLQRCVFPTDRTVQECILLQIKKLLGFSSTLKWLKYYLTQKKLSQARLIKLKEDLLKKKGGDNKNYQMMRQLVLNEINQKLQVSK